MVTGLSKIQIKHEGVYKGCAQGKNAKNSFPKINSNAKGILDLIHSDICGPMQTTSLSGYSYYSSFIDDYSRKTWIYFLKKKDEVFEIFKEFKSLVENLSKKKTKILRSDNGGEFTLNEFNDFCKEAGIKRELTIPHNPQQNGVVERKNIYITEDMEAMIHDKYLLIYLLT